MQLEREINLFLTIFLGNQNDEVSLHSETFTLVAPSHNISVILSQVAPYVNAEHPITDVLIKFTKMEPNQVVEARVNGKVPSQLKRSLGDRLCSVQYLWCHQTMVQGYVPLTIHVAC